MPLGASAAVVNKKTSLRRELPLAQFGRTGHSSIQIQSAYSRPFALRTSELSSLYVRQKNVDVLLHFATN